MTGTIIVTPLLLVSFSHLTREDSQKNHGKDIFRTAYDEIQNGTRLLQEVLGITLRMKTNLRQLEGYTKREHPGCCGHEFNQTLKSICLSTADECWMHIDQTESKIKQWIMDESDRRAVRRSSSDVGEAKTYRNLLEGQRRLEEEAIDGIICTFNVSRHFIELLEGVWCLPVHSFMSGRGEIVRLLQEVYPIARALLTDGQKDSPEAIRRCRNRIAQYKEILDFYKWLDERPDHFYWHSKEPLNETLFMTGSRNVSDTGNSSNRI